MLNGKIPPPHKLPNLLILGASETAKRLTQFIEYHHLYNVIGYAVSRVYYKETEFNHRPIWILEDLEQHIDLQSTQVITGVFWNHLNADRRKFYEYVNQLFPSIRFANVIAPTAIVRGEIGENNWIMDYVIVQESAKIGNNCILADRCVIGDLTRVDDHCFIGVNGMIGGACTIGKQTFIGLNATILNNVSIGDKCLIGATTMINHDISNYTVVKAPTNNQIEKTYLENEIENKWIARFKK